MRNIGVLFGVALLGISGSVLLGLQAAEAPERDTAPNGKGIGTIQHPPMPDNASPSGRAKGGGGGPPGGGGGGGGGKKSTSNGINYHGGPLLAGQTVNMYYIWYGDWSGNSAQTILDGFANNLGGSDYFNINTTYYDGNNLHVVNDVRLVDDFIVGTSVSTSYPYGKSLSDSNIQQIVADAIANGLSMDPTGVYFVLTSADVTASSGFCTQYCGWHTYATMTVGGSTANIKYAFIGNPDRCPSACSVQTTSPNGNAGADAMASIIAHELSEAATDPNLNAWYDHRGYENADKCAWTFGTTYTTSNGSIANMKLNGVDYLIQQNWVNANGGYCAMSY